MFSKTTQLFSKHYSKAVMNCILNFLFGFSSLLYLKYRKNNIIYNIIVLRESSIITDAFVPLYIFLGFSNISNRVESIFVAHLSELPQTTLGSTVFGPLHLCFSQCSTICFMHAGLLVILDCPISLVPLVFSIAVAIYTCGYAVYYVSFAYGAC